jgi:hypothetical protein
VVCLGALAICTGRPRLSANWWILVLSPPRERPRVCRGRLRQRPEQTLPYARVGPATEAAMHAQFSP